MLLNEMTDARSRVKNRAHASNKPIPLQAILARSAIIHVEDDHVIKGAGLEGNRESGVTFENPFTLVK